MICAKGCKQKRVAAWSEERRSSGKVRRNGTSPLACTGVLFRMKTDVGVPCLTVLSPSHLLDQRVTQVHRGAEVREASGSLHVQRGPPWRDGRAEQGRDCKAEQR
jgi:hypothetical protein